MEVWNILVKMWPNRQAILLMSHCSTICGHLDHCVMCTPSFYMFKWDLVWWRLNHAWAVLIISDSACRLRTCPFVLCLELFEPIHISVISIKRHRVCFDLSMCMCISVCMIGLWNEDLKKITFAWAEGVLVKIFVKWHASKFFRNMTCTWNYLMLHASSIFQYRSVFQGVFFLSLTHWWH